MHWKLNKRSHKLFGQFCNNKVHLFDKDGFFSESAMKFFQISKSQRKIFQKAILSLKFKFPTYNSKELLAGNLNYKLRLVFLEYFFFWDLEIWKTNPTFWKKATFTVNNYNNIWSENNSNANSKSMWLHCVWLKCITYK